MTVLATAQNVCPWNYVLLVKHVQPGTTFYYRTKTIYLGDSLVDEKPARNSVFSNVLE